MRTFIRKFQEGGAVEQPMSQGQAPEQSMEQPQGQKQGGSPMEQILAAFQSGLSQNNCDALKQGATMFMEMIQQQGGGEDQPAQEAPAAQPQGQPQASPATQNPPAPMQRFGGKTKFKIRPRV
jgi:hypothetical protein